MNLNSSLKNLSDALQANDTSLPSNLEFILRVMRLTVYPLTLTLGIMGNLTVCLLVFCDAERSRKQRPSGRFFIVNLAVSDLLVLLMFIPFDLAYLENDMVWTFGVFMCKLVNTLTYTSVVVSGTTLAVISIDRYRAIVHPLRRSFSTRTVLVILVVIWLYAVLTLLPFTDSLTTTAHGQCTNDIQWWPSDLALKLTFLMSYFVPGFALPICCISGSYVLIGIHLRHEHGKQLRAGMLLSKQASSRAKQNARTIKLLTCLVAAYTLCILPHIVLVLMTVFDQTGTLKLPHITEIHEFTRLIVTANSCVNPLMYSVISKEFRAGVTSMIWRRLSGRSSSYVSTSSRPSREAGV